jgi:hypothetical protein
MAKKRAVKRMNAVAGERVTKPVRLDLSLEDHERLERLARRFGLSKTAYVRLKLFSGMEADEGRGAR